MSEALLLRTATTTAQCDEHYCSVQRAIVVDARSYIPWHSVLYYSEVQPPYLVTTCT